MKLHHRLFLLTGVFAWPACAAPDAMTSPDLPAESLTAAAAGTTAGPIAASTIDDRAAACARDPRVVVGAVTVDTCVGADLFFREPFGGNGRTCATCHRVERNLTIDPAFIATLPSTDP